MGLFSRFQKTEESLGKPLPGPGGLPVLGASPQLGKYAKIWDGFSHLNEQYGNLVGVQIGSRYCLLVNTAEHIKEILVNRANQFSNRPDFIRFNAIFRWNRHLSVALCDWSPKQKTRRELIYSPMHPKTGTCILKKLSDTTQCEIGSVVDRLIENGPEEALSPRQILLCATGNIFYQTLCSTSFDWDHEEFLVVTKLYNEVFHELFQGFAIDFMPWLKPFYRTRLAEMVELAARISRFTDIMIDDHERTLDQHKDAPRDVVDILLLYLREQQSEEEKEETLDKEDIDVIVEDLAGGFPVLTNMIMWALWMVAGEAEVQEKIYEEYKSVVGTGVPNFNQKKQLLYSDAVMYETLRMVCSPIIPHVANEDTQLHGYRIPKDTMVMFNTCDLNFNPEFWEEPEKFQPERFIRNGEIHKPDYFFPFGTGKRSCMGDGFVRHIVHLTISTLFGNFKIGLAPETNPIDYIEARGKVIMDKEPLLTFEKRS